VKRPADVIGNAVSVMRIATVFYNFVRMHKTGSRRQGRIQTDALPTLLKS
jgi:hypothetical protein